jgi:hypothetical protein
LVSYVFYLLDSQGNIRSQWSIESDNDSCAIIKAREILAQHAFTYRVEIWIGTRRVRTLSRQLP